MDSSIPDTNFAPKYLIPCGILAAMALGLCVTRIYTRLHPVNFLAWDDYIITIAEILSLAGYCTAVGAAAHGWGHLSSHVSEQNRILAFKYLFATIVFWIISIGLVRISVAWSLLRFSTSKIWKGILWTLIGVQLISSSGLVVFFFFGCHPLRSFWEPVPSIRCWDRKYALGYDWVSSSILVLIDFILALMPIHLIRTLHRPLPEKILISCLMAMGLLATTIAIIKMTTFKRGFQGDPLSTTVIGSLWPKLEEQVGIIAACMPCLKAPAEKLLRRVGILVTRFGQSVELPSFVMQKSKNLPIGQIEVGHDKAIYKDGNTGSNGSVKSSWNGKTVELMKPDTAVYGRSGSVGTGGTGHSRWEAV